MKRGINQDRNIIEKEEGIREYKGMNQDLIVDEQGRYVFRLQFRLPESRFASIVSQTIEVDRELNAALVEKQISSNDNIVTLIYKSKDPKKVRSAIKNTIENICLSLETIQRFK